MLNFKEYILLESVKQTVHLSHLEEMIWLAGSVGVDKSLNFINEVLIMLKGHAKSAVTMTVKYDGAPGIYAGIHPERKVFVVGTKSIFSKGIPKAPATAKEVDELYPDSPKGLTDKLKLALKYLPELGIKGMLKADFMFSKGEVKSKTIDGEKLLIFTPNTITYAVPADSDMGRDISKAQIGLIFHTAMSGGPTIHDMKVKFGPNIDYLKKSKNVWYDNANFKDMSGKATLTAKETAELTKLYTEASKLNKKVAKTINNLPKQFTSEMAIFINQMVRKGTGKLSLPIFTKWLKERSEIKQSKLKSDAGKVKAQKNIEDLIADLNKKKSIWNDIFSLHNTIVDAKNIIIKKLNNIQSLKSFIKDANGYKVTAPEGFVAIDKIGTVIKFVDRLEFSAANFAHSTGT